MRRKKAFLVGIISLTAIILAGIILLSLKNSTEAKLSAVNAAEADSSKEAVQSHGKMLADNVKQAGSGIKRTVYKTDGPWIQLCEGGLKASQWKDGYILHPASSGKTYESSSASYMLTLSTEYGAISQVKNIQTSILYQKINNIETPLINADERLFDTIDSCSFSLPDGRLAACDIYKNINLWVHDDKGTINPLLSDEEVEIIRPFLGIENDDSNLVRFAESGISPDGKVILLCYAEGSVKNGGISEWCLCSFDISTRSIKLLYRGQNYNKYVQYFGVGSENAIIFFSDSNTLFICNLASGISDTIAKDMLAVALSPDGRYLLYRECINAYVQQDFTLLDIQTMKTVKIPMPEGYFYNMGGAWSPDSSKFAFSLNGSESSMDPKSGYRTNIMLGVIDIKEQKIIAYGRPKDTILNALGNISFAGGRYVIANSLGGTTYAFDLEYDENNPYEIEHIFDRSILAENIIKNYSHNNETSGVGKITPIETWYPRPHDFNDQKERQNGAVDVVYIDDKNGWKLQKAELSDGAEDYAYEVYRTKDGGYTWEKTAAYSSESVRTGSDGSLPKGILPTHKVDEYYKEGISFLDENNGFITGICHREGKAPAPWMYVTFDGGYTWKRQMLIIPPMTKIVEGAYAYLSPPEFFTPLDGIMKMRAEYGDWKYMFLYFTHDGGRTWDDVQNAGMYTGQWIGRSGSIEWDFTSPDASKVIIRDNIWIYYYYNGGGFKRIK